MWRAFSSSCDLVILPFALKERIVFPVLILKLCFSLLTTHQANASLFACKRKESWALGAWPRPCPPCLLSAALSALPGCRCLTLPPSSPSQVDARSLRRGTRALSSLSQYLPNRRKFLRMLGAGVGWAGAAPRCRRGQGRREGWREGWGHPWWGTWGLPAHAPPGSTLAPRPLLCSLVTGLRPRRQRLLPWALSCAQTKESQCQKFLYIGTGGLFFSLRVQCPGARDRRVRKSHLRLEQIVETSVAVATKIPC